MHTCLRVRDVCACMLSMMFEFIARLQFYVSNIMCAYTNVHVEVCAYDCV
jgi:hypothetical protein